MKKTKWYGPDTVPGQNGIYECKIGRSLDFVGFYYWNGAYWEFGGRTNPTRVGRTKRMAFTQDKHWRGLTEEVKA